MRKYAFAGGPQDPGLPGNVDSVNTRTGAVTLTKSDVALANADNTSDANKPVSTAAQAALDAKAPIDSPTLTGAPASTTASPGTNTTQIATTAYVVAAVAALINSAPGALDTLKEFADAIGDDANFAATIATALAGKQPLDATLTALAGASTAANKLPYFSGVDTVALTDITAFGRTLAALADYAALRTGAGLVIGTDVQAHDADLDALAGLTSAANKLPYFTGSGAAALADFSSYGRTLANLADAPALRGQLANLERVSSPSFSATPSINTDLIDQVVLSGLSGAITSLTSSLSGTPVDGQMLTILFKDNGTARAITHGASFESMFATLPTTTTLGKWKMVIYRYMGADSKWGCVNVLDQP